MSEAAPASPAVPKYKFGSHLGARIGRGLVHFVPESFDASTQVYTGTKYTIGNPGGHPSEVAEKTIAGPWSDDIATRRALTAEFDAARAKAA